MHCLYVQAGLYDSWDLVHRVFSRRSHQQQISMLALALRSAWTVAVVAAG